MDSSTQSVKVVIRDAATGALVRSGRASHPDGTEVDPRHWWDGLRSAIAQAGGLDDVEAISVAGQQHGMVCLDDAGAVVRPALLWNDTRSAAAAADLVSELGADTWAESVGSVPVASFTVTKLRWLATHEPEAAARTAAVCLPHDWLTWQLTGAGDLATLVTDRSDASGTGYWSPSGGAYRPDLLEHAFGRLAHLPRVLDPTGTAGKHGNVIVGAGAGDNAGAALGLGARPGDVVVSLGTSGTVFGVSTVPAADPSAAVAGFADASGHFLPLVCTLNAAQVLDATARLLGVGHDELATLALSVPSGADGLTLVPYLNGERTPDRPHATGSLHGLTLDSMTAAHLARAAIEGMFCGLADGLDALRAQGLTAERVLLIGGAAANPAVQRIAPSILGCPVTTPPASEYVADGAARQAAWTLTGTLPTWQPPTGTTTHEADPAPDVRSRYAEARDKTLNRR
ncbi:xylulokinase [Allocatelliglobosispora scoriae]|uniref:Xylulose kinase n=1 Tax=Allocatelliglobosispora scoriae TaxID=643052 RepID=A0A841BYG6_9ACTN|nr:xylulokinase [Allocatelliglobosispora scoriae]